MNTYMGPRLISSESPAAARELPTPALIRPHGGAGFSTPGEPIKLTKKEMAKEAAKEAMGSLRAFAESKPSKSAVRDYFKSRIEELNDDYA